LSKQICGKASAAVVKSTLGFTVTEPQESFDETEIECTYRAVGNGNSLVVKFRTGQDAASFARNRRDADSTGMPTTDVDGVGDQAYATAEEFDALVSNTLVGAQGHGADVGDRPGHHRSGEGLRQGRLRRAVARAVALPRRS
jgi:hypothetical protein